MQLNLVGEATAEDRVAAGALATESEPAKQRFAQATAHPNFEAGQLRRHCANLVVGRVTWAHTNRVMGSRGRGLDRRASRSRHAPGRLRSASGARSGRPRLRLAPALDRGSSRSGCAGSAANDQVERRLDWVAGRVVGLHEYGPWIRVIRDRDPTGRRLLE
jgi:hypothetical protein